jgi:hypothetical protein
MTKRVINQVRDYLTVISEDRVYQIVNAEMLLKRHPPDAVVGFLALLRADYKKELRELLKENRTSQRINQLVVLNFRLKMAINTIRNAKQEEVQGGERDEIEPRAAGSG